MLFRIMIACASLFLIMAPSAAAERTLVDDKGRSAVLLEIEGGLLRYENASFDYAVNIPNAFDCAVVVSDNNDGITLQTKNKEAQLSVAAAIDVSEKNVPQPQTAIKALTDSLGDKIFSQKTKGDAFTIFWRDGETDYYRKIVYKNGVFFTLDMNFPNVLRSQYGLMAIKFGESLVVGD